MRDSIAACTGDHGIVYEDTRNWCLGWRPTTDPNCTKQAEYEYESAESIQAQPVEGRLKTYGGGGYILRLRGFIDDLKAKIVLLKEENWVNNRTRSLHVEFSVYNPQVSIKEGQFRSFERKLNSYIFQNISGKPFWVGSNNCRVCGWWDPGVLED